MKDIAVGSTYMKRDGSMGVKPALKNRSSSSPYVTCRRQSVCVELAELCWRGCERKSPKGQAQGGTKENTYLEHSCPFRIGLNFAVVG